MPFLNVLHGQLNYTICVTCVHKLIEQLTCHTTINLTYLFHSSMLCIPECEDNVLKAMYHV